MTELEAKWEEEMTELSHGYAQQIASMKMSQEEALRAERVRAAREKNDLAEEYTAKYNAAVQELDTVLEGRHELSHALEAANARMHRHEADLELHRRVHTVLSSFITYWTAAVESAATASLQASLVDTSAASFEVASFDAAASALTSAPAFESPLASPGAVDDAASTLVVRLQAVIQAVSRVLRDAHSRDLALLQQEARQRSAQAEDALEAVRRAAEARVADMEHRLTVHTAALSELVNQSNVELTPEAYAGVTSPPQFSGSRSAARSGERSDAVPTSPRAGDTMVNLSYHSHVSGASAERPSPSSRPSKWDVVPLSAAPAASSTTATFLSPGALPVTGAAKGESHRRAAFMSPEEMGYSSSLARSLAPASSSS
ncbi:MAG: hypothetical protein EOO41_04800, partial [Methanobacteriota archaeon]